VLFSGSEELQRLWLEGLAAAPAEASPLAVVTAGLDPVAEMFAGRHPFARVRAQIIEANPELQERELIKLQSLAASIKGALVERGVPQNDPSAFRRLMNESLEELRSVTAAAR
jgi:hypothetical protein